MENQSQSPNIIKPSLSAQGISLDQPATGDADVAIPAVWQVGDIILDHYEVTGTLGEGGMGTVYKVHHRGWKTDLAVKSPKPEIFARAGGKENFIREAETWVNLGLHPYTVSCYYVRTLGGIPRVFAEYVAGGSLADWIRTRRLYDGGHAQALERILDVAIQFAWGLDFAHEQGLIHQDVKSANVMMTADGIAKLTDFGLANARAMAGEPGVPGGHGTQSLLVSSRGMTPAYCSPEQATGRGLSRKTDLWSWGLSVLEMFVGGVTWMSGVVAREALARHQAQDPAIPLMPAEVVQLLARCFALRPEERPATMREVATTLQTIYARLLGQSYRRDVPRPVEVQADSLNNRALSLFDLGKVQEAQQVWEQALQVDPQHLEATYNRGITLWRHAELTDDILVQQLENVCATYKDRWQALYLLALVHMERGDRGAALVLLAEAAQQAPGETEVQTLLEQVRPSTLASGGCLRTFQDPRSQAASVCLSTDGRFALASSGYQMRLWEVATGDCLRTFQGHTNMVSSVCFSADGRLALSGSGAPPGWRSVDGRQPDNTMRLWDVTTGDCLRIFQGHRLGVSSVCLSADGHLALSGSRDGTMRLWEVATGDCLRSFQERMGPVNSDATPRTRYSRHPRSFQKYMGPVNSVCLSADGHLALSGSGDGGLRLWDVATGDCLHTFRESSYSVSSVCLSADGRFALSSDSTLQLWEVATGRCLRTFQGHTKGAHSVCLSADGRFALSGHSDSTLRLWEVATGRCLRTFQGHTGTVSSVCFSTDGRFALSSNYHDLRLWEVPHEPVLASVQLSLVQPHADVLDVETRAAGLLKLAEDVLGKAQFATALDLVNQARTLPGWERVPKSLETWARLLLHCPKVRLHAAWQAGTFQGYRHVVISVCLSANGRLALSGSNDRTMRLWDVITGDCLCTFQGHTGTVSSVCFSTDGRFALSGGYDRTLRLWEVATGRCLRTFQGHTDWVNSVCLSADGCFALSGSKDNTLRLWEVATGRCLRIFQGHTDAVNSVCLSADGRFALSGSGDNGRPVNKTLPPDNTLRLWEVATGTCLRTFQGHTRRVTSVCLSADGRFALSGSGDYTLRLWEVATGTCLRTFQEHTYDVTSVCLSADGRFALSGSADQTVRLWEVATGTCLHTFQGHTDWVKSVSLSADGRFALSGSTNNNLWLWELDWELEARDLINWDEGALLTLETFLTLHTPFAGRLPQDREPSEQEIQPALTRHGRPSWNEQDFQNLIRQLQYAGYGWLRPEGVRRKLEEMAASWQGPPPVTDTQLSESPVADT
ncbi:protein kinase domain-containing protein [Ktedonobacter racemifer]|nr:protein kinase [Ktedonobacter racemifer]